MLTVVDNYYGYTWDFRNMHEVTAWLTAFFQEFYEIEYVNVYCADIVKPYLIDGWHVDSKLYDIKPLYQFFNVIHY